MAPASEAPPLAPTEPTAPTAPAHLPAPAPPQPPPPPVEIPAPPTVAVAPPPPPPVVADPAPPFVDESLLVPVSVKTDLVEETPVEVAPLELEPEPPAPITLSAVDTTVHEEEETGRADQPSEDRPRQSGLKLAAILVGSALAITIVVAAFRSSAGPHTAGASTPTFASTTTTASPTTTTTAAPTTTATPLPPLPQSTAEGAARAFIAGWAQNSEPAAAQVGTSQAVVTIFVNKYQAGLAIDRGCNTVSPATCAFGPPGGASPADPLYQLTVAQEPNGGWYVSAVQILG